MAKALLICFRHPRTPDLLEKYLNHLNRRLIPDNIQPAPPLILSNETTVLTVFNPNRAVSVGESGVCLGSMFPASAGWWIPGSRVPDGSYAIFRMSSQQVELVADCVASRTIWYAQTDDLFLASTSQRAITACLGDFQPDLRVVPWMLSSGLLGPDGSWDRRVRSLSGGARLTFDRAQWRAAVQESEDVRFIPRSEKPESKEFYYRRLRQALEAVVGSITVDESWSLPLSGGVDSRAILMMLEDRGNLKCLTWGIRAALDDPQSDAAVAREVARFYHVNHRYFPTDLTQAVDMETVYHRFLTAGEGRTDQVRGYIDGCEIWRQLYDEGIHGIIRGDECFGDPPVHTPSNVRGYANMHILADFENTRHFIAEYGLSEQVIPERYQRRKDETLEAWRDRLIHTYFAAAEPAALNDVKSAFVEIMNPLLSHSILAEVRRMPDALRTGKSLFRQIVWDCGPKIAFARNDAVEDVKSLFRQSAAMEPVLDELRSTAAGSVLPPELLRFLADNARLSAGPATVDRSAPKFISRVKSMLPNSLYHLLSTHLKHPKLDLNRVAFRAYIIIKMHAMLSEDAKLGADIRHETQ